MTYTPRPCGSCGGAKGHAITTTDADGKTTHRTWVNCGACGGRGVR